jgi:hypothetical protein|tara:strand:- start:250 stop:1113 length:864 start_codon:yes stop_codon:yes gene_type:complete
VLLPSKALKKLHQTVPICLSGNEIPGNCDLRYGQFYYFFMFNADGELTTVVNISNGLTDRINEGMTLPKAFVDMVHDALKIEKSLDDYEQAYIVAGGSETSYQPLVGKLTDMQRIGSMRVVKLLRGHADQMKFPTITRLHALSIEIEAVRRQVINNTAINTLAASIELFLVKNPSHPKTKQLIDDYFDVALRYSFDLDAHCQSLANQWQPDAPELAEQILDKCQRHLKAVRQEIDGLKDDKGYDTPRLYAQTGDAHKTIQLLDRGTTSGVFGPIHRAWREAAKKQTQ